VAVDREETESDATPPALRAPVPIAVAPSRKVTVPVGVPPGPVTVAVKVTDWPKVDGFGEAVRAAVLVALLTTCETAEDVEPMKFVSPP
jgi:hypothetical protein